LSLTSLLDVANIINSLSDYKVDIEVGKGSQSDYCGNYAALGLKYIGLNDGINKVFKNLKISYNSHDSIPIQK
jgi:hypothetical protein